MRKWKVVALPLLAGLVLAPLASAQSDDELRREVEMLRRDLQKVIAQNEQITRENAELKNSTVSSDLEERINALTDSLDYAAGTTVDSVANPITFRGEFRVRSGLTFDRDFGRGSSDAEDDAGTFHDGRFLVAMDFDFSRDVTTRFSMQANGLFDDDNDDLPADSSSGLSDVDLYEAWIEVRNIFGRKELSAKSGRQEITLGNELHFGNNDFFSGNTFDATRWLWGSDNFDLHFIAAKMSVNSSFNSRNHPYPTSGDGFDDDEMYALYFTLKSIKNHTLDVYVIYFNGHNGGTYGTLGNHLGSPSNGDDTKGSDSGHDFYSFTVGFRLDGMFNVAAGLDYSIEVAYQFGNLNGGADGTPGSAANPAVDNVSGLVIEAEVGITFSTSNNFRLYARFYYAEGADGDDTGFIPLFPERHAQATAHAPGDDGTGYRARYGILDIIPMDNVWSIQLGMTFDPATDWTIGLTALYAEHEEDVSTPTGMSSDIGFEIDAFVEYRYSAETTVSAGLGVFFPEDGAPHKSEFDSFAGDDDDIALLFYIQTRVVF